MILTVAALLVLVGGCKKQQPAAEGPAKRKSAVKPPAAEREYTLYWNAMKAPDGGIGVRLTVPTDWDVELDAMDSPTFRPAVLEELSPETLSVVAVHCGSEDEGACLEKVVGNQYSALELAQAKRRDLGAGHWIAHRTTDKGERVHARLFVTVAEKKTVVMCVANVPVESDLLHSYKRVCASLALR